MIHVSLDLETLSSESDASIAAIGVVAENFETAEKYERYDIVDDPTGRIEPRTVRWHKAQRGDTLGPVSDAAPLTVVLAQLSTFFARLDAHKEGAVSLWTHATFDIPILGAAYRRATGSAKRPWHFRNCRDLRTLYDLAGGRPEGLAFVGTAHNALDDARYQMEEIRACLRRLGR